MAALGFKDYESYLSSDLWRSIRRRVLARDDGICGCGQRAEQVHHSRYEEADLRGDTLECLTAICVACHRATSVVRGWVQRPEVTDRLLRKRWASSCQGGWPRKAKYTQAEKKKFREAKRAAKRKRRDAIKKRLAMAARLRKVRPESAPRIRPDGLADVCRWGTQFRL